MINLTGVTVPIITPVKDNQFDKDSFQNHLRMLLAHNIESFFILGTTGEFQNIPHKTKKEIIYSARETLPERVNLLVGITGETIDDSLALADHAADVKADAVVFAPMCLIGKPEDYEPDKETLQNIDYLRYVASNLMESILTGARVPIMLYNNPAIHHDRNISLPLIRRLGNEPLVIGIKDSSGQMGYFHKLITNKPHNFYVLQGREHLMQTSLNIGAQGVVAGTANVHPTCFQFLVNNPSSRAQEYVNRLKETLKPANNYIKALKRELVRMGVIDTHELYKPMKAKVANEKK